MTAVQECSSVAGILLAAGASKRFTARYPKLLAELDGIPLVRWVAQAALGSRLSQVLVVLGHAAGEVRHVLQGLELDWVLNPAYNQGQSTSVRVGLDHLDEDIRAALFLPGDQPLITSQSIDRLIAAHEESGRRIVQPQAQGRPGAPILWERSLFPELMALIGDTGGRRILSRHAAEILRVEIGDPLELVDVDTLEQLRYIKQAYAPIPGNPDRT